MESHILDENIACRKHEAEQQVSAILVTSRDWVLLSRQQGWLEGQFSLLPGKNQASVNSAQCTASTQLVLSPAKQAHLINGRHTACVCMAAALHSVMVMATSVSDLDNIPVALFL